MDLEHLWRGRLKSILGQIEAEETDYEEVASLAEHIGADYHGRFLIELLQNAEDQTTKAGISDGLAIVVRTRTVVAMCNPGVSFDYKGIRAITSAGISPKKVEESIGNKGVGFKAVFQVSDRPEIYSSNDERKSLSAQNRTAFRMEHTPFQSADFRERMKTIFDEVVSEDSRLRSRLEGHFKRKDLWPSVLECLKRAAPFKFPKPLAADDFEARIQMLSLHRRLVDRMATLVVLPLLKGDKTSTVVEQALDELVATDAPGSVLLFLRGISRLRVYDHVRGHTWLVTRDRRGHPRRLTRGATLEPLRTTRVRVCAEGLSRAHVEWWRTRRRIGRDGDDPRSRGEEVAHIKAAVARLPGRAWRDVRSAYAAIALPRVEIGDSFPEPFPVAGMICIGLPSRKETGGPAWFDGPFHGNIARTEIDLGAESQPYNRLIFEECMALFWQTVDQVRKEGEIGDKRGILFWFSSSAGALTEHFAAQGVLPSAEVILARSGQEFLAAEALRLPDESDSARFETLFGHVPDLKRFGFLLPDPWLLSTGRKILDTLAGDQCRTVQVSAYLELSDGDQSLLETAASLRRSEGPVWWEPFLEWVTECPDGESVGNQAVLPVTGGGLARAKDRVFLRPHGLPMPDDKSDDGEDAIEDLDPTLSASLRFLDERCVRVRRSDRPRDLTDLARKLSPDGAEGLVRRPRRPELINDVLAPALLERTGRNPQDPLCAVLLARIGEWLGRMGERDRARVVDDRLRVPTSEHNEVWAWRAPEEVYLGRGWVNDPDHEQLFEQAYGHREGTRLPPWEKFSAWTRVAQWVGGESPNREAWQGYLETMGVNPKPRILVHRPRQGYFKSSSYDELSIEGEPACPFPQAASIWHSYLQYLRQRPAETRSGQVFFARPLSWIDGLEDPDAREAVVKLVLARPHHYEEHLETSVERQNRADQRTFQSLWVWAIRKRDWAVVPSNNGPPKPADTVWILRGEERRRRFVEAGLLDWLPDRYDRSRTLTTAFGIYSPDTAPIERIARELHRVAKRLPASDSGGQRNIGTLIQTLYEWLQERCARQEESTAIDLGCLLTAPVPLMRNGRAVSVRLEETLCIYLNDDPQRAEHIAGFTHGYSLPLSAKSGFEALFDGLNQLLGAKRVRRVSEEPIDVNFQENRSIPGGQLLDLVEHRFAGKQGDIARELAALIAYGRPEQPMDPAKRAFIDHWNRIRDCRVVFGKFLTGVLIEALFDVRALAGPTLYVASDLGDSNTDLVRLCWHVVGRGHRNVFEAFAGVLLTDKRTDFFRERRIGSAEWDELAAAVGASLEHACERLRAIAFASWRRECPERTVSAFESAWDATGEPAAKVLYFLSLDEAAACDLLSDARRVMSDEEEGLLADGAGITLGEWQEARDLLGLERVRFTETERAFGMAIRWVAGAVTVAASRYIRLNAASAKTAVDAVRSLECPAALAEARASGQVALEAALRCAADAVSEKDQDGTMAPLVRALSREADRAPKSMQDIRVRGVPRRELTLIIDHDESRREVDAREAVRNVLRVAEALAEQHEEDIDGAALEQDSRVARHTAGWWADAYAALRGLKRAMASLAPRTVRALAREKAFGAPRNWRELWRSFHKLGDPEPLSPGSLSPAKKRILGIEKTPSEFELDLAEGSDGEIGQRIRASIQQKLDLAAIARQTRERVRSSRGGGGSGGGSKSRRQDEDKQVGLLGEVYVYEHFTVSGFPDFDRSCWVSENRGKYGDEDRENAGLGYDFFYRDVEGRLTGRNDAPVCFIEVKSTTGDGRAPFPITANEWGVAQNCHDQGGDPLYVIVRVRHVWDAPEIFDVIIDPVQAMQEGWLRPRDKDLYLITGAVSQNLDSRGK